MQPAPQQFPAQPLVGATTSPYGLQQTIVIGIPQSNGFATAGMVLGIISMMFSAMAPFMFLICCIVSLPLALLGIIFSHIGYSKAKTTGIGKGQAIAGLILNWPQLLLGIIPIISGLYPELFSGI
jgi:hypothetical protein